MDSWELGPLLNTYGHHTPLHHFCGPLLRGRPQNTSYWIFAVKGGGRGGTPNSAISYTCMLRWFLRPYLPLIGGIFLLGSGFRVSFWALEVPEPRVRPLSLTNMAFSSLSVRTLPVPETKIYDHFSIETYP